MRSRRSSSFSRTPISLINRLKDGRPEDWETFHSIYGPMVYRVARRCGLTGDHADEITSIVMSQLTPALMGDFRVNPDKGRFRGYVASTTRRAIGKYLRTSTDKPGGSVRGHTNHQGRSGDGADPRLSRSPELPPDEQLAAWERRDRMRLALERLEKKCGQGSRNFRAFRRYVIEGEPAKDVAKHYGLRPQRLYEIKHDLMGKLERILRELDEELGEV